MDVAGATRAGEHGVMVCSSVAMRRRAMPRSSCCGVCSASAS
eukprot:COSAG05_NODE_535_length_8871_cov_311.345759_1_plen_41_part_10